MLHPSQISDLKHKDPDLFNLFRSITEAINNSALQMGIDPKPASHVSTADAIPPPRPPSAIEILVVSPVVFITLEASPEATDSAFYFIDRSESPKFTEITRYALGHGRHLAVAELPGTTYWRAFAKYQMSLASPFVVWEG